MRLEADGRSVSQIDGHIENHKLTLEEIIEARQNKYQDETDRTPSEFFKGYYSGWYWAYQDLKEILQQNDFDMEIPVVNND
jgi:hypothetical protein